MITDAGKARLAASYGSSLVAPLYAYVMCIPNRHLVFERSTSKGDRVFNSFPVYSQLCLCHLAAGPVTVGKTAHALDAIAAGFDWTFANAMASFWLFNNPASTDVGARREALQWGMRPR